jgi:hypothetical protein
MADTFMLDGEGITNAQCVVVQFKFVQQSDREAMQKSFHDTHFAKSSITHRGESQF